MSCRNKEINLYVVHKIAVGISDHVQVGIQHILFTSDMVGLNLNHT